MSESEKSSGSVNESEASDSGSSYSWESLSSGSGGVSDSSGSDISSDSGSGTGGGGGGDLGSSSSGSGSEGDMAYSIQAEVSIVLEGEDPVTEAILEGNRSGFLVVKNDGDSEGGLFCDWYDFVVGQHYAIITGSYTEPADFSFTWNTNTSIMLSYSRVLKVRNTGWCDIDVNGTILARFEETYIENTSESANWPAYTVAVSVTRA